MEIIYHIIIESERIANVKEWYYLLYQFDQLNQEIQHIVYRSFYTFVYKEIYFLVKDHAITEDLIQESFFKILSAVHKHEVSKILPWIKQVARNQTLDYLRKIHKDRHLTYLDNVNSITSRLETSAGSVEIEHHVENKIRDELLHELISNMKPEYRILILLYYIEEMTIQEVAEYLQLSKPAISQKLKRARKKLLEQFQRKWDIDDE